MARSPEDTRSAPLVRAGGILRPEKRLRSSVAHIAFASLLAASVLTASAIVLPDLSGGQSQAQTNSDAQLLLAADQLVYDNDANTVTAIGNVQLEYDGYNVVAERVAYNRQTRHVTAYGNVEIVEPDGNRIYADEIDLTDDFGDGFINALRVETPDNTRFAAESAERFAGQKTVFNNGVYTACEPCAEKPDRAPIWQIKARKVIQNGVAKTVTYKDARFEFFGLPIAYLPYFSHADPSVKRKSGFLISSAGYVSELGWWYRQPYFWATSDSTDLTIGVTGFQKQGVLYDLRWRHQLENGFYTIRAAGIDQNNPSEFNNAPDSVEMRRVMVATRGTYEINPRWTFGWDVLVQSDETFSHTYQLSDYSGYNINNKIYLRGLHDRSYFDLSGYQFLIQSSTLVSRTEAFQAEDEQALVRPVLDYNYVKSDELTGGQWNLDVNVTSLDRDREDIVIPRTTTPDQRVHGIEGNSTRLSGDLQWKKTATTASGLMFTPSLSLRGDYTQVNEERNTTFYADQGGTTRFMPTAALETSYPVLAQTENSSHVIEPIAQFLLRPDLHYTGVLPNEDSQSLVFDATTLFERDKFSGYDRIEGGSRANVGVRYSGVFNSGVALTGLVGQSFHLAGRNPYAREDDLTNTGEESGLETDESDFVAAMSASFPIGIGVNTQARFDESELDMRRGEAALSYRADFFYVAANYTFIDDQPDYGFPTERQQAGFTGTLNFAENWSAFGGAQFDVDSSTVITNRAGMTYHDECFTFSLFFSQSRTRNSEANNSIGFKVSLRTIGEYGTTFNQSAFDILNDDSEF